MRFSPAGFATAPPFRGWAVAVALLAAGCSDLPTRDPVALPSEPPVHLNGVPVSGQIPIPTYNTPGGAVSQAVTVQDSAWYVVQIQGAVEVRTNPEYARLCSGNSWPDCPPPAAGQNVGPNGIDHSGQTGKALEVTLRVNSPILNSTYRFNSAGATTTTAVVYIPKGATLVQFDRTAINGSRICLSAGCGGTPSEPLPWAGAVPWYTLSGPQSYSFAPFTPLEVRGGESGVAPGDTVPFAATANTPVDTTTYRWYYLANDTLASPQNPQFLIQATSQISACNAKRTCRYVPATSGRMYVEGVPVGSSFPARAVTAPVWRGARLKLDCDGAEGGSTLFVQRTSNVRCAARTTSGTATSHSWTFTGHPLNGVPLNLLHPGDSVWAGPMVASGTVRVTATVGGHSLSEQLLVGMLNRSWSWGPSDWPFGHAQAPPISGGDDEPQIGSGFLRGWNCRAEDSWACANLRRVKPDLNAESGGYTVVRVSAGPNQGFWYVGTASFTMPTASNMNGQITSAGRTRTLTGSQAALCRSAMGLGPTAPVNVNFYTFNETCMGVDVDAMLTGVWNHEEYGRLGNNGHESVSRAAAGETANDPVRAVEDIVRLDSADVFTEAKSRVLGIQNDIHSRGGDHSVVTNNWNGGNFWVWDPSASEYALVFLNGN